MRKPRILLADDHSLVLEGFRRILEDQCDVVGTAEDGRALLEAVSRLKPNVVLLDISMPLLNGIDATRHLKKVSPDVKVIFVTMHADPAYLNEAFKAGASGYLLKRSAGTELIQAIQSVLRGNFYVTPLLTKGLVNTVIGEAAVPPTRQSVLTPRQREVLQLVAEGKAVKEIAQLLNISPKTVEFHKAQIMEQLDLRTTAELTKYAMAHGLTSP
ncbi:MAG: response regulator transcription factor [Nitrospiraceae bacterium]